MNIVKQQNNSLQFLKNNKTYQYLKKHTGRYKLVGIFTVYRNGHVEWDKLIDDENCAAFVVIAIQITRNVFKASALPTAAKRPEWWSDGYAILTKQTLLDKEKEFQKKNERKLFAHSDKLERVDQLSNNIRRMVDDDFGKPETSIDLA